MPIVADGWYDSDPDPSQVLQGDVIDGVPVVFGPPASKRWVILRFNPPGAPLEQAEAGLPKNFRGDTAEKFPSAWARPAELVLAKASVEKIMIVSQSCDIDWRKTVQVAPVKSIAGMTPQHLNNLRDNDVGYWFYLPADGRALTEGYADLSHITTIDSSYLRPDFLIARLSARGTLELQKSLGDFFGRPFGFNIRDDVPQPARYGCASCFLRGAASHHVSLGGGGNFPQCPLCGEDTLWVKLPPLT